MLISESGVAHTVATCYPFCRQESTVLISESGVAHTVATYYPFCREESTVLISESGVAHTVATSYPFCRKESSPQSSVSLGSVGQVPRHGADIDNDRHSVPLTDKGSSLFIRYISIYMHTCSVYIHVYIHVQVWGNCCTHYLPAQHWRNYSLLLLAEVESANINNQTNSKQTEPQLTFL